MPNFRCVVTDEYVPVNDRAVVTPTSLLVRARALDPAAWVRLVDLYAPLVYRWGRQAGLQDSDAADIGQDVFRAVARALPTFRNDRPGDTFRGWLRTITRNKVRDFARKADAGRGVGGSNAQAVLHEIPDPAGAGDAPGDADEELLLLRRAVEMVLADLKEENRQAFLRVVMDDQDPADVARDLGMTVNAVYLAKSRILRRLREEFADLLPL